jgi:hypothetical protein
VFWRRTERTVAHYCACKVSEPRDSWDAFKTVCVIYFSIHFYFLHRSLLFFDFFQYESPIKSLEVSLTHLQEERNKNFVMNWTEILFEHVLWMLNWFVCDDTSWRMNCHTIIINENILSSFGSIELNLSLIESTYLDLGRFLIVSLKCEKNLVEIECDIFFII